MLRLPKCTHSLENNGSYKIIQHLFQPSGKCYLIGRKKLQLHHKTSC